MSPARPLHINGMPPAHQRISHVNGTPTQNLGDMAFSTVKAKFKEGEAARFAPGSKENLFWLFFCSRKLHGLME